MKKVCPKCGTETEGKFCPECGTDLSLISTEKVCPKCGIKTESKFCPECGTHLIEETNTNADDDVTSIVKADTTEIIEGTTDSNAIINSDDKKKQKKGGKKIVFIIIGVLLILFLLIGVFGSSEDSSSSSSSSTESETSYEEEPEVEEEEETPVAEFTKESDYKKVSYDKLARTPDDYMLTKIQAYGKVVQVMEGDGETQLRVATSSDGWDDVLLVYYSSDLINERILEDDWVTLYGTSYGLYTYTSTMGGEITVPLVSVEKIVRE